MSKRFASIPLSELTTLTEQFRHWTAESSLIEGSDPEGKNSAVSDRMICIKRNQCLSVICPKQFAHELNGVVGAIEVDLSQQFELNVDMYMKFRALVSGKIMLLTSSGVWAFLQRFLENVAANIVSSRFPK